MISLNKALWNFDTPHEIVFDFVRYIYSFLKSKNSSILDKNELSILDIFAGDGRLGIEFCNIIKNNHHKVSTTYVEIDKRKMELINPSSNNNRIININAFAWYPNETFDLIITNPPFEILNVKKSKMLGFDWDNTKIAGRNIYGLSILKCLELCSDGGLVAAISPFSWLSGVNSIRFREELYKKCSRINITAFNHRGIFKNVIQDVGFQLFIKRSSLCSNECKLYFSYNGIKNKLINNKSLDNIIPCNLINVRVGPIVWNRKMKFLTSEKTKSIPLIYGGNINHNGVLDLKNKKYNTKQFILYKGINNSYIIKKPAILIRRTLRGRPGQWKVDSCIFDDNVKITAENHIIVIEILSNNIDVNKLHLKVINKIKEYYYYSGSPNISTKIVRSLANKILQNDFYA